MNDCVFCKIRGGEIETDFIYQSDRIMAFNDIHPLADTHILIVPKLHIKSFVDIDTNQVDLLAEMVKTAQNLIKDKKIESGYKLIFNGGNFQEVPHVHWHLLGGRFK